MRDRHQLINNINHICRSLLRQDILQRLPNSLREVVNGQIGQKRKQEDDRWKDREQKAEGHRVGPDNYVLLPQLIPNKGKNVVDRNTAKTRQRVLFCPAFDPLEFPR